MSATGGERPRLLIVAGPNGGGKTTVTDAGLAHRWFKGCEYINPDIIAQRELGDWNDPRAVLQAAQLAAERREACLREGRSLAFETVFSAPDKVDFVHRGIAAGFFVRLFFVGTDGPEINAARVARRMLQGGHEVPIRKIIDRWSRSISNCVLVANVVDRLYVYDNSVNERPAQLVVRASAGTVARRYAPARPWMAPILAQVMEPQTKGKAVFPPFFQKLIDDAELKGRVEGLAKMLLIVLRARGMAVTDAARERILAEKDPEQLLRWIERAAVAGSIADVLDDPS